jgi:hypothetical protein
LPAQLLRMIFSVVLSGLQELNGDNKLPATTTEEVLRNVFRFMVCLIAD